MFELNFEQNKRLLRALPAGRISHFTSRIYPSLLPAFPLVSHHMCHASRSFQSSPAMFCVRQNFFPSIVYQVCHGFLLSPAIKHRCTLFQPIRKETCIETDKLIRKPVSISLHRLATIQSKGTVLICFRTAIKKKKTSNLINFKL